MKCFQLLLSNNPSVSDEKKLVPIKKKGTEDSQTGPVKLPENSH